MLHGVGFEPLMPDVGADWHLVETVDDMGWCLPGGMGLVPLTAGEVAAWCGLSGVRLTPWEFRMVRRMSSAYVAGTQADAPVLESVEIRSALATAAVADW